MTENRLFALSMDKHLFQQLEPYVRISVILAVEATHNQQQALERILGCWGTLGYYAAMPDEKLKASFGQLVAGGDEVAGRQALFRSGGAFKYSTLIKSEHRRVEWIVEWGGASKNWLDVLLNCLEGYHVQVAPIERVELRSNEDTNED